MFNFMRLGRATASESLEDAERMADNEFKLGNNLFARRRRVKDMAVQRWPNIPPEFWDKFFEGLASFILLALEIWLKKSLKIPG